MSWRFVTSEDIFAHYLSSMKHFRQEYKPYSKLEKFVLNAVIINYQVTGGDY